MFVQTEEYYRPPMQPNIPEHLLNYAREVDRRRDEEMAAAAELVRQLESTRGGVTPRMRKRLELLLEKKEKRRGPTVN